MSYQIICGNLYSLQIDYVIFFRKISIHVDKSKNKSHPFFHGGGNSHCKD